MKLCYGVFAKVLNLCKPGKRQPTQKELNNRILSSVYEPYRRVGIADDASTRLLQCKQGLQEELIKDARRLIDKGETWKVAEHFQKKIIEQHLLKSSDEMKQALVLTLLDIIAKDETISDDTVVDLVGNVAKRELLKQKFFCMSDFIAGVFLYTVVAVDNRAGREFCQRINEKYFCGFIKNEMSLGFTDRKNILRQADREKNAQSEITPELEAEIIKCNHALSQAQNTIRVYAWDELDFKSIYVMPMLGDRSDSLRICIEIREEKQSRIRAYERIRTYVEYIKNMENEDNTSDSGRGFSKYIKERELMDSEYLVESQQLFRTIDERNAQVRMLFAHENIVYIVGGAGYGKSLFLKNLCVAPEILEGFRERPLLIIKGDIKRLIRPDGSFQSMDEYLEKCFINGSLQRPENIDPAFLKKCLKAGRCLVLLDALDEVGNDLRNELHHLIISYFENTYPGNKVCITSRERGFIPCKSVKCYYIRAITSEDVKEYVARFIGLNKFGANEAEFIDQAESLIKKGFVKGFLTLSLLMAIYRNEEELPTNKLLLYEKCFEYIATTREKSKRLLRNSSTGEEYDWSILGKFMTDATFMELAHVGTPNNKDIPLHSIKELMIGLYGKRFDSEMECKLAAEMFLQFCADRTEVFIPSPSSNLEYKFFHRSFYEYFYAKYIAMHTNNVEETYRKLLDFDVDSEIFELLVTIYERSDPNYLREFMVCAFQHVERMIPYGTQGGYSMDILAMLMRTVEEKDLLCRFVDLILEKGDAISRMRLSGGFGAVGTVLMRDQKLLARRIQEKHELIEEKVEAELIRFLLMNDKSCEGFLMDVKTGMLKHESSIESVRMSNGFTYTKLTCLCPEPYEMMDHCFKKLADRQYLCEQREVNAQKSERMIRFLEKVMLLTWDDRSYVYNKIIQMMRADNTYLQ